MLKKLASKLTTIPMLRQRRDNLLVMDVYSSSTTLSERFCPVNNRWVEIPATWKGGRV
ncbi:hypothetical protein THTE_2195 [Thermogutta terrifontis]|uniref:Uncharacterized protein n=1 Tax=Thermogutta terrifontis TaxID=1331910 RepID=A0A286RFS2_9BACT|nr:hypothetical protein THTE_2195 [Thermogutta terrifontis]